MQRQNHTLISAISSVRSEIAGKGDSSSALATMINLTHDHRIGRAREDRLAARLPTQAGGKPVIKRIFDRAFRGHYDDHICWNRTSPDKIPEVFTADNGEATLLADPPEWRELVRVVRLNRTLNDLSQATVADVAELRREGATLRNAARWRRGIKDDPSMDAPTADAVLNRLVTQWNKFQQPPPFFCGRLADVKKEADDAHWPELLRNRFGLGNLTADTTAPLVLAQLRYMAADVWDRIPDKLAKGSAFRVPTTLEANFYEYFFPAPTGQPYGRTIDLRGGAKWPLTCEMIHFPVDIVIEHIHDVVVIDTFEPPADLSTLRNDHLTILRDEFGCPDYAEFM